MVIALALKISGFMRRIEGNRGVWNTGLPTLLGPVACFRTIVVKSLLFRVKYFINK